MWGPRHAPPKRSGAGPAAALVVLLLNLARAAAAAAGAQLPLRACYEQVLPMREAMPTLSADVVPLLLSHVRINVTSWSVEHSRCGGSADDGGGGGGGGSAAAAAERLPLHWPTTFAKNRAALVFEDAGSWPRLRAGCANGSSLQGMWAVLARDAPLHHFGHRMLSDLPALWSLRTYLLRAAIDVGRVGVSYVDQLGQPAWGPANFRPLLQSLGFASYEVHGGPGAVVCYEQAVLMPVYYHGKWHVPQDGTWARLNMWRAPEALYDADPLQVALVGHLRSAAFGLPARLPFAPAANRTIVLASRDRALRQSLGFRLVRILDNERELLQALRALPGVHVEQVELGALPMDRVVRLLGGASLLLGYHGAAFDNLVFLPRGAYVLEILPSGTNHGPLYPALARRTGKEFARYVNPDPRRQSCRSKLGVLVANCSNHYADLDVDVPAVVSLVRSILHVQRAALARYAFDDAV